MLQDHTSLTVMVQNVKIFRCWIELRIMQSSNYFLNLQTSLLSLLDNVVDKMIIFSRGCGLAPGIGGHYLQHSLSL